MCYLHSLDLRIRKPVCWSYKIVSFRRKAAVDSFCQQTRLRAWYDPCATTCEHGLFLQPVGNGFGAGMTIKHVEFDQENVRLGFGFLRVSRTDNFWLQASLFKAPTPSLPHGPQKDTDGFLFFVRSRFWRAGLAKRAHWRPKPNRGLEGSRPVNMPRVDAQSPCRADVCRTSCAADRRRTRN